MLVNQPHAKRLCLNKNVHASLEDWQLLAQMLHSYPVPITTLVPRTPTYLGSVDVSGIGLGGFWVPTSHGSLATPLVFRVPLPIALQKRLVSSSNITGDITNSDFELAALVLGFAVCVEAAETSNAMLWCGSDNVAAVSWCTKGSTLSTGLQAHLLHWLAKLTRDHSFSLCSIHVPGSTNTLADFCSRSFHLYDQEFLDHLNAHYPISPSWTLVPVNSDLISKLNWKL
jgi:hypothetical protein